MLQLKVIEKVSNLNTGKVLALNRDIDQFMASVTYYLSFKSTSGPIINFRQFSACSESNDLQVELRGL